jgi:murein DD-endopeptidase MepM/ murein hydrolase activator NlpD
MRHLRGWGARTWWVRPALLAGAALATLLASLGAVSAQETATPPEPTATVRDPQNPSLVLPFVAGQMWRVTCGYTHQDDNSRGICGHSGSQWNRYALDLQHVGGSQATAGQPVLAAADGRVTEAEDDSGLGWHVYINHGGGYTTVYGHMREPPTVAAGDEVHQGDVIGLAGCTGRCTGDHVHFVLLKGGVSVPPEPLCGYIGLKPGQIIKGCTAPPPGSQLGSVPPATPVPTPTPNVPNADVNGDGRSDGIIYYRSGVESRLDRFSLVDPVGGPVPVWRGETTAAPADLGGLVAGDFSGDGRPDVAALARGPGCTFGLLVFVAETDWLVSPDPRGWWSSGDGCERPVSDVVSGDFDGDVRADVALLYQDNVGALRVDVLRSDGKRFLLEQAPRWSETLALARAAQLLAGDFNADGLDDVAVLFGAFSCQRDIRVLLSSDKPQQGGGAVWWRAADCKAPPVLDAAAADFDGDRRDDVLLFEQGAPGSRQVDVLHSDGQKLNASAQPWWREEGAHSAVYAVMPGDFTGDGRADLALLSEDQPCRSRLVLLGSLGVAFLPSERWSSAGYCREAVLGTAR